MKEAEHQRLLKSTEKCVEQDLRYIRQDLSTGAIENGKTISQILDLRPDIPELRIQSLEWHLNNYLIWAEQVRMYLLARGVHYVLEESDEENIPGTYDSLNTTLRDHDDALARFILSTALTDTQCVHIREAGTAKQSWAAIKKWYGPRDGSEEEYVTAAQLMEKLREDVNGGNRNQRRNGRRRR